MQQSKIFLRSKDIFSSHIMESHNLSLILEQILSDCEEGVSYNLVSLLKEKPDLFYIILNTPYKFTQKHTNILNQIISFRNIDLLKALLDAGLDSVLQDVLDKTQYNILYTDYPNASLEGEKDIALNIKDSVEWNNLLNLLMQKKLLPSNKIDKFSWAIINKPDTLKVAFETNYFDKPHDDYWEYGLSHSNSSVMIDFINSVLLNDVSEFKIYCHRDFQENGQDIKELNKKLCFYLPDFLIFHNLSNDLEALLELHRGNMKNWLLSRKYKIEKEDLEHRIFEIYKSAQWQNNWTHIHQEYANPWDFLSKSSYVKDTGILEVNCLDYAFLCQSDECYQLIESLSNESMLESYISDDMPEIVKSFLFSKKLHKGIRQKSNTKKLIKV